MGLQGKIAKVVEGASFQRRRNLGCVKSAQEGSSEGHKANIAWENRARPGSSLSQILGSSSTNCWRPEERGAGSSTVVAPQVR